MKQDEKDLEASIGFMKIANSLAGLAGKMKMAQENGEQVDVFAAFKEANRLMQNPGAEDEVIESDKVQ